LRRGFGVLQLREILDFCIGGIRRNVPAGTLVLHEGGRTGHLFVLIEGRLDVIKSDTIVASVSEQGAVFGEMSVLLDKPHTATVRAAADSIVYEINDAASFLRQQPAVALLIARLLAQRLNVATTYLADIMHQYAGHGDHLAMIGDILQSMINLPPITVSPGSDRQSDPRM
jgi:CRP/FNR family transcriptional regulator, cyclic AMP receptor protein